MINSYIEFQKHFEEILNRPFWSPGKDLQHRILFKDAKISKPYLQHEYSKSGCYVFGVDDKILYIGKTTKHLWKRLRGRYFIGENTQFELAKKYEKPLREFGINGLPQELIESYKMQYKGSTVRLNGAAIFAKYDINRIWYWLIPIDEKYLISEAEVDLIHYAEDYNKSNHFDSLINVQKYEK